MKGLILNSGMGTRMGILTSEQPKCMTEVFGTETILSRQLRQLIEFGIEEVVITTGAHEAILREYVRSLDKNIKITFVLNKEYKETNYIYSIYLAREFLDDDIVLMHGDLVFENEVMERALSNERSCMIVSSTTPLPQKDFKAVVKDGQITDVGIDFFDDAVTAQPLYKINKQDWKIWLNNIEKFCESGREEKRKCYAENAFNEVSGDCDIEPLDIKDLLCSEIDTPEDLAVVADGVRKVEQRTVYVSFSTDVIHSGHIALIKKARRLGKLIVGVISDEVVASYKRFPTLPFEERKILFENIVGVEKVVEQKSLSYRENIEKLHPSFVVHGDDWKEGFQKPIRDEVIQLLESYGGKLIEYPYASDPKYANLEKRTASSHKMTYIENDYKLLDQYLVDNHIKSMLFVCGKAVEYHPLYKHIINLEKQLGIVVHRFSEYSPNPKYEAVEVGVNTFLENKCDSILALGGGSAIDVAKCIKLFATMEQNKNYLDQRIEENNILLMAIPTTAGTGSEVTRYAVIYYKGLKQSITHESCIPSMVFVDPSFLKTVSSYYRKATMFDALCHAIESYWSVNSTDESKAYAKEAITMILENKESYIENSRQGNICMQRASQLAGQAINISQTTAGHALCYGLTSLLGIAHGLAAALCVSVLWPYMIAHIDECTDKRGEKFLNNTMKELRAFIDKDEERELFTQMLSEALEQNPTSVNEFTGDLVERLCLFINEDRLINHPIKLNKATIKDLYMQILDKYKSFVFREGS